MNDRWLLIDCNYLMWRAFHTRKGLSHGGLGTGATYGFFCDLQTEIDRHATSKVVFCFDGGNLKREAILRSYKESRKKQRSELNPEQIEAIRDLKRQIKSIRYEHLPAIGFRNVFAQDGYEADDVIAWLAKNAIPEEDSAIIVTADKDMYQLLSPNVFVWNPTLKEMMTRKKFVSEYGVKPWQWPMVKAIAGCGSDDVPGLFGVGEKTACRYVAGTLDQGLETYKKIEGFDYRKNMKLVCLPFPGCGPFKLVKDNVSAAAWQKVADRLGMRSIRDKTPGVRKGFGISFS